MRLLLVIGLLLSVSLSHAFSLDDLFKKAENKARFYNKTPDQICRIILEDNKESESMPHCQKIITKHASKCLEVLETQKVPLIPQTVVACSFFRTEASNEALDWYAENFPVSDQTLEQMIIFGFTWDESQVSCMQKIANVKNALSLSDTSRCSNVGTFKRLKRFAEIIYQVEFN